jgi:hypothetical protein
MTVLDTAYTASRPRDHPRFALLAPVLIHLLDNEHFGKQQLVDDYIDTGSQPPELRWSVVCSVHNNEQRYALSAHERSSRG